MGRKMIKRMGPVIGLCVVLTALGGAPATGASKQKIVGLSHTSDSGITYFCGKLKGKPGKRYVAKASGPQVMFEDRVAFKMPESGRKTVSFIVNAGSEPSTYSLTFKKGSKVIDKGDYEVPPPFPAGEAEGPFTCPADSGLPF